MPLQVLTPVAIADKLREDIARGRLRPGEPLRQEALAERFSVSRMPVRDALRQLESEGVVTLLPNRGAHVSVLSVAELQEIFHLRRLVEIDLLQAATERMDAAALSKIRFRAKEGERLSATPDWIEGDRNFHQALYLPAERPRQLALAMSLRSSIERYAAIYRELPRRRSAWIEDHRALIRACEQRDAAAAGLRLAEHLDRAEEFLMAQLAASGS